MCSPVAMGLVNVMQGASAREAEAARVSTYSGRIAKRTLMDIQALEGEQTAVASKGRMELFQLAKQGLRQDAATRVSVAESGLSGNTAARRMITGLLNIDTDADIVRANTESRLANIEYEKQTGVDSASMQIEDAKGKLKGGGLLEVGSQFLSGYSKGLQLKVPTAITKHAIPDTSAIAQQVTDRVIGSTMFSPFGVALGTSRR